MQHPMPHSSFQHARSWLRTTGGLILTATTTTFSGLLFFHRAAWKASAEPITLFLNETDTDTQNVLTAAWRDTMQSQLIAILMTSALVGSVVAGGCAWPQLANSQESETSTILALWYSSLLLAVTATGAATQQIFALSRLSSYPDGLKRIRCMLSQGKTRPSRRQIFLWWVPVSLLNSSLALFVAGLCAIVYYGVPRTGAEIKIVAIYSVVAAFCLVNYLVSSAGLYYWIDQASKAI